MPARRAARGKALNVCAHFGFKSPAIVAREAAEDFAQRSVTGRAEEAVEIFTGMGETYCLDRAKALVFSGQMDLLDVLQIFREIGDPFYLTYILWELAVGAQQEGNLLLARQYLEESLALNREIGYCDGEGSVLLFLGRLAFLLGDPIYAVEKINSAAKCFTAAGSIGKDHYHIQALALCALAQGDYQQAEQQFKYCLAIEQEFGIEENVTLDLISLSKVAWASGRMDLVNQYLDEAMQLSQKVGYEIYSAAYYVLARKAIVERDYAQAFHYLKRAETDLSLCAPVLIQAFGVLAAAQEQMKRAAVLFAFVEAYPWFENMISLPEREAYRQALAAARAALNAEEFAAARKQGQAMNTSQALAFARLNELGE